MKITAVPLALASVLGTSLVVGVMQKPADVDTGEKIFRVLSLNNARPGVPLADQMIQQLPDLTDHQQDTIYQFLQGKFTQFIAEQPSAIDPRMNGDIILSLESNEAAILTREPMIYFHNPVVPEVAE